MEQASKEALLAAGIPTGFTHAHPARRCFLSGPALGLLGGQQCVNGLFQGVGCVALNHLVGHTEGLQTRSPSGMLPIAGMPQQVGAR